MLRARLAILALPATTLLALISCQQTASDPAAPAATPPATPLASAPDPHTFGVAAADLTIDLATQSASLTPVRSATAIGDDYSELGLTPAFNAMFGDNFEVVGLRSPLPGQVEVDVQITHPFSPAVRPDLGIFNVRCTLVTDRAPVNVGGVNIAPDVLANADGYSDSWQLTHPSSLPAFAPAPVQPYIILREDPSAGTFDFQNPAGYNVLFPGQTSTDTLTINIGTATTFQARLYLTADYGQSAVRATRQTPAYELPKFAGNAPWKIVVTELSNDLEQGQTGSSATYQVDIWDWKHGAGLGSDVDSATLSVPGVTTSPLTLSLSGTGTDPAPLTATTLVTNAANALEGVYTGLVTVTDTAQGIGLEENLATPVSFGSYTTYMTFPVAVEATVLPPTAVIARCIGGDLGAGIAETFDASGSTPGSNPIATYEWDWNYDGSNFTVDATGIEATHAFSSTGTPTVALRVSDGSLPGTHIATTILAINPAASWRAPVRVTNNGFWDQIGDFSEIGTGLVTDSNGVAHLIYYDYGSISPGFDFTVFHQSFAPCPGTWSAPQQIHQLTFQNWVPISAAMGSDDRLHVIARTQTSEMGHLIRNTDGSWTPITTVTTNVGAGFWTSPQLAMNGAGDLGLLLLRELPAASGGGPTDGIPEPPSPVYFTRTSGGVWGPMTQIGTMNHKLNHSQGVVPSLTLAGTSGSDFVAVWSNLKSQFLGAGTVSATLDAEWTRSNSGVFQPEALLYTALSIHDRPLLKRAPNGTLFLGMESGAQIRLATYTGSTWSPTLTLIHSVGSSGTYQMAFDPATGAGMLVTSAQGSGGPAVRAKRFLQTDTPAAIAASPDLTILPAGTGWRLYPQVTSLGGGRWLTLWGGETYGLWQSGVELESSLYQ